MSCFERALSDSRASCLTFVLGDGPIIEESIIPRTGWSVDSCLHLQLPFPESNHLLASLNQREEQTEPHQRATESVVEIAARINRDQHPAVQIKTVVPLLAFALVGIGLLTWRQTSEPTTTAITTSVPVPPPAPKPAAREIDVSHVDPGSNFTFSVAGRIAEISVPAGQGYTDGSFSISVPDVDYFSRQLSRDGSLHRIWIGDVTADAIEDAVIVIQSGGSGSYADIFLLETTPTHHVVAHLPEFNDPDYMGHDAVSIRDGKILRVFPTYVDQEQLRLDRQWEAKDALKGRLPVRRSRDSNASPSGEDKGFLFNRKTGTWMPL